MNNQRKYMIGSMVTACIMLSLQSCSRKDKPMASPLAVTDLSAQPHPTGSKEWTEYWHSAKLIYPEEAKQRKIEGRVVVKFTVDENGYVRNPMIVKATDPIFSQVSLDYMKGMPQWTPAEKYGHKIAMDMYQPFMYTLGLNGMTTVMTVSADTSFTSSQMLTNTAPSYMSAMVHGDKNLEANAKVIEKELKNVSKANAEIAAAQKEIAEAEKEMAEIQKAKTGGN